MRWLSVVLFVVIWQILALIINSEIFPSVIDIINSLIDHLVNQELFYHLLVTLKRVIIAFLSTMIIGIIFGIIMGLYKKIDDILDFILILGLNIPALITVIVCYIWFGLSDFSAILAVIINKVPLVIVNIREGTRSMNKRYFDLIKVYNISQKESIQKIYLPQIYPYIMATTRLCLSLTWKIILFVELLGRSDGVGFQISMFFQFFDISSIFAYSFSFILIIYFIESVVLQHFDNKINKWK